MTNRFSVERPTINRQLSGPADPEARALEHPVGRALPRPYIPPLGPVGFILGLMLLPFAAMMAVTALSDLAAGSADWRAFVDGAGVTGMVGALLVLSNRGRRISLDLRQAFLLTISSWLLMSAFGALPFMFGRLQLSYADAFFETVSGLTTTGSTVLSGLDRMPPGILLWRGVLQWYGGIGIIVMAVAMLPLLKVGGMQLFRMESSDRSEKVMPRLADIVGRIAQIYLGLTVACALAYRLAGMSGFEAGIHAMTTLSTGGYSTSDASIGHFASPAVEWIAILFMILGSLPFILYVQVMRGAGKQLWQSSQVRSFLLFVLAAAMLMTWWLAFHDDRPLHAIFRSVLFNITSVVTTTGFASENYGIWGGAAVMAFFFLTFVGGCAGSTSGGIKIYRFEVAFGLVARLLRQLAYPHSIQIARYGRQDLSSRVVSGVLTFLVFYVLTVTALTLALAMAGLDFVTSLSGAATAVGNVGPGLGPVIGPAGNFASLADVAKWLLSIGMLLGRLEMLTVLVLLSPAFWRH